MTVRKTASKPAPAPTPTPALATRSATAAAAPKPAVKAAKAAQPLPKAPTAPKATKAPAAPAPAAAARKIVKAAKLVKAAKPAKPPKLRQKPVRDSFTMPEADFALIATLKARALSVQRVAKKSELLRAGLHALAALDTPALVAALGQLDPVKIGRPKQGH